jgi:hypothetical protein
MACSRGRPSSTTLLERRHLVRWAPRGSVARAAYDETVSSPTASGPSPKAQRYLAIAATSHVNARNEILTREALEDLAAGVTREPLPSFLEHDHTRPPIGRVVKGWVEQLEDGEWAAKIEAEIFKEVFVMRFVGVPPVLRQLPRVSAHPDALELQVDRVNFPEADELLDAVVESVLDAGDARWDDDMRRYAAVPDPQVVVALTGAGALWWFSKGFFTRLGERLGDDVAEDLSRAYVAFKGQLARLLKSAEPEDVEPVLILQFTLECDERRIVVEGSVRSRDPQTVSAFADSGRELLEIARNLLARLPDGDEVRALHFTFDVEANRWRFSYGMYGAAIPFLIAPASERADETGVED